MISTRVFGKQAAYSSDYYGRMDMVLERLWGLPDGHGAEWSWLAPGPEELSDSDEVQQGLTAGQTFSSASVRTARRGGCF